MSRKNNVDDPHAILQKELGDAYDFDPADPMAGLTTADMSGNKLTRRTVLRLMAASGTLTAASLLRGARSRRTLVQAACKTAVSGGAPAQL